MPRRHTLRLCVPHRPPAGLLDAITADGGHLGPPPAADRLSNELAAILDAFAAADPGAGRVAALLAEIERAISAHTAQGGWTRLREGLPTSLSMVLAWHRDCRHIVLEYVPPGDGSTGAGDWFTLDCEPIAADEVLAWRPLPPDFAPTI